MNYILELMNKKAFTLDEERAVKLKNMLLGGNLSSYVEIDGNIIATHQIIGIFKEEDEVEKYPQLAEPKMTPEQIAQRNEVISNVKKKLKWTK